MSTSTSTRTSTRDARPTTSRTGLVAALLACLVLNVGALLVPGVAATVVLQSLTGAVGVVLVTLLVRSRRARR